MAEKAPIFSLPVSTIAGAIILGVLALVGIAVVGVYLPEQNLPPTPLLVVSRNKAVKLGVSQCEVGKKCSGPTLSAVDPEGDPITFHFYDKTTGKEVTPPIKSESGKTITPDFKFDKAGQKQVYLIVEDGAGHASAEYPMIIEVR